MPPKKKAKKTQTVSLDKRTQAKMLRDKASALEAEATAEETPKKGVSEKFKKKVLELFDKFSIVELPIPKNLKKIQDTRTLFECTYKCTKFYERYYDSGQKLKVGTTNVCLDELINEDYHQWEIFDKYINNEEEYLKNITKDSFEYDEHTSAICLEGEIMYEKERILKWHAEEGDWLYKISEGNFCTQDTFYENLKFAAYEKKIIPGRCIKYEYGDYKNWEKCFPLPPSTFAMYAIDPQFIFEEIWKAIIIAEPFDCGDNIRYEYDDEDDDGYDYGLILQGGGWWFAQKFSFHKVYDETNPHKKKAWESATDALRNIDTPILSVEDVKNVKGIGKSSLAYVEELLEQRKNNLFWKKMEKAEIREKTLSQAKGCPALTEIYHKKWIVNGDVWDYDNHNGFNFEGALKSVEDETKVYPFAFRYNHAIALAGGREAYEHLDGDIFRKFEVPYIDKIAMFVVSNYCDFSREEEDEEVSDDEWNKLMEKNPNRYTLLEIDGKSYKIEIL